jgi:hypothetical protein
MSKRLVLILGLVLAAAVIGSVGLAQQPAAEPPQAAPQELPPQPPLPPQYGLVQNGFMALRDYQASNQPLWSQEGQSQSAKLAKQYAKAEKDEEKKEIRKKLADLLTAQFDQQVAQQQKELEALEKQIASVKATLKKRTDAKTAIVDRRLEQLILEAEGMGWGVPTIPAGQRGPLSPGSYPSPGPVAVPAKSPSTRP